MTMRLFMRAMLQVLIIVSSGNSFLMVKLYVFDFNSWLDMLLKNLRQFYFDSTKHIIFKNNYENINFKILLIIKMKILS